MPFAHWLVATVQPRLVVELGTQNGVSFSAICEAMQRSNIPGRCYAIDTWIGDKHAGFYDDTTFNDIASFIRARYGDFAELIRRSFESALPYFEADSIDLLHIDGLHTYEAVKGDFETWRPKLSDRGVVLVHDTNARREDFGVWRFWAELRERYPTFEFLHDHGLGIAAVGRDAPRAVAELCELDPLATAALRDRFAQLGARWAATDLAKQAERETQDLVARHSQHLGHLQRHVAGLETDRERLAQLSSEKGLQIASLETERESLNQLSSEQRQQIAGLETEREELNRLSSEQRQQIASLETERERLAQLSSEQRQQIAGLEMEREGLTQLSSEQRQQIAGLEMEREHLTQLSSEQRQQIAGLEIEREHLTQLSSTQRQHIAGLETEREHLTQLSSAQRRLIASLETEGEGLAQLSSEQRQQIADLEIERGHMTQLSSELHRQIADLEAEREHLRQLSSEYLNKINDLQSDRKRRAEVASEYVEQIARLKADRDHLDQVSMQQRQRIAELETERERMAGLSATQFDYISRLETEAAGNAVSLRAEQERPGRPWRSGAALLQAARLWASSRAGRALARRETAAEPDAAPECADLSAGADADAIVASRLRDDGLNAGRAEAGAMKVSPARNGSTGATAMRASAVQHVDRLHVETTDALARAAAGTEMQFAHDRDVIQAKAAFNARLYLGPSATPERTSEALEAYLRASRRLMPRNRPSTDLQMRRPLEGFHPLIYMRENADHAEASEEDPLAHYARTGFPAGRWRHDVIRPSRANRARKSNLRVLVHGHFHYPELLPDLVERLRRNQTEIDLLVTTTSLDNALDLKATLSRLSVTRAGVVVLPNRGRNIGPFLSGLGRTGLSAYDVVAHLHGKRSPHLRDLAGDRWRNFLWENLIGGEHAMMDLVLEAFAAKASLGLVFPEDPHLSAWGGNRMIAEGLAKNMGLDGTLPSEFEFPQGAMFWTRPAALKSLFELDLAWNDFPAEPVPVDGTVLHAIERLLPFSAAKAGFSFATTYVESTSW